MIKIRPLIQFLGKIIKLPGGSYIDPESLGSGTPNGTNFLRGDGTWQKMIGKQSYLSWSGFFFETLCLLPRLAISRFVNSAAFIASSTVMFGFVNSMKAALKTRADPRESHFVCSMMYNYYLFVEEMDNTFLLFFCMTSWLDAPRSCEN